MGTFRNKFNSSICFRDDLTYILKTKYLLKIIKMVFKKKKKKLSLFLKLWGLRVFLVWPSEGRTSKRSRKSKGTIIPALASCCLYTFLSTFVNFYTFFTIIINIIIVIVNTIIIINEMVQFMNSTSTYTWCAQSNNKAKQTFMIANSDFTFSFFSLNIIISYVS